ncbi:hypothetical protein THAOC_25967, partial [Thalassiosira oceanica]
MPHEGSVSQGCRPARRPPPTATDSSSPSPSARGEGEAGHGGLGAATLVEVGPDRGVVPDAARGPERESRSVRPRNRWSPPALTTRTDGPGGGGRERCADDDDGRAAGCGSRIQGDSRCQLSVDPPSDRSIEDQRPKTKDLQPAPPEDPSWKIDEPPAPAIDLARSYHCSRDEYARPSASVAKRIGCPALLATQLESHDRPRTQHPPTTTHARTEDRGRLRTPAEEQTIRNCVPVAKNDGESCANCGKLGSDTVKLKNCNACRLVKYCGVDCQRAHRKQHKKACKQRAAELKDEELYSQGHERPEGDFCPICTLPIPLPMTQLRSMTSGNDTATVALDCKRDFRKAIKLWKEAAELGSVRALYNLGNAYYDGEVVQVDKVKFVQYHAKAAVQGYVDSRYNLGCYEGEKGNLVCAVRHFLISAKMGHEGSVETIKRLFVKGLATKEQYADALKGYQDAVEEMKSHDRDEAKAYFISRNRDRIDFKTGVQLDVYSKSQPPPSPSGGEVLTGRFQQDADRKGLTGHLRVHLVIPPPVLASSSDRRRNRVPSSSRSGWKEGRAAALTATLERPVDKCKPVSSSNTAVWTAKRPTGNSTRRLQERAVSPPTPVLIPSSGPPARCAGGRRSRPHAAGRGTGRGHSSKCSRAWSARKAQWTTVMAVWGGGYKSPDINYTVSDQQGGSP